MPSRMIEHCILAFATIAMAFWLDVVPGHVLGQAAKLLLAWAVFSTLLVASAGAWVALGRSAGRRALSR